MLELLDLANLSGALEKLLQKFETSPSESSKSSTFQQFQVYFTLLHLFQVDSTRVQVDWWSPGGLHLECVRIGHVTGSSRVFLYDFGSYTIIQPAIVPCTSVVAIKCSRFSLSVS